MSNRVDLWLDEDDIQSASTNNGFNFTVPPDAVVKGNLDDPLDEKAKASWTQRLQVVECKFYEDETKGDAVFPCITAEVTFQVPPDAKRANGAPDPNAGRQHRVWYRIVQLAIKDKNHPKFKATKFAMGKLSGILRSIWGSAVFPTGSDRINFGEYFNEPAPILQQFVLTGMRASKWNGERRDEITDFVPLELQK